MLDDEDNIIDVDDEEHEDPDKPAIHPSLMLDRMVLVIDEAGQRRDETCVIVKQILPNSIISTADSPADAHKKIAKAQFDTYVINLLMPGYSSSPVVKAITNDPLHPLLVGFAADKMSDAYDPKKGIKIKPLRRIFEIESAKEEDVLVDVDEIDDVDAEADAEPEEEEIF